MQLGQLPRHHWPQYRPISTATLYADVHDLRVLFAGKMLWGQLQLVEPMHVSGTTLVLIGGPELLILLIRSANAFREVSQPSADP